MNYGDALKAMLQGERVSRSGWNGKGMWIAYTPGSTIPLGLARAGAAALLAEEREKEVIGLLREGARRELAESIETRRSGEIKISAHIDMKAADGSLVIGWLASQTDMLATDWEVVSQSAGVPYTMGDSDSKRTA